MWTRVGRGLWEAGALRSQALRRSQRPSEVAGPGAGVRKGPGHFALALARFAWSVPNDGRGSWCSSGGSGGRCAGPWRLAGIFRLCVKG